MSGAMVRATIREIEQPGTGKRETRRIIKPRRKAPSLFDGTWADDYVLDPGNAEWRAQDIRFFAGQLLWVRETFVIEGNEEYRDLWKPPIDGRPIRTVEAPDSGEWEEIPHYHATDGEPHIVPYYQDADDDRTRWRPSIHMPRWASRITLEVTAVKVERLNEISEEDCMAEGCQVTRASSGDPRMGAHRWFYYDCTPAGDYIVAGLSPRAAFEMLWCHINGPGSWEANPFVVAVTFIPHRQNIDQFIAARSADPIALESSP